MDKRNLGAFEIPIEFVEKEPEQLARIFGLMTFVPVRVECLWHKSVFEYIGLSPKFKEVPEGATARKYQLTCTDAYNGEVSDVTVTDVAT
ncbi:hypothetical protein NX722_05550 [Endozoicomonas gorgoniicola]|uniref:Uncharacterized protein n=1 Tax=Endozoicomonas gorgoniicola TaxID=1234144 RepID=A0ABT3MS03_9GAMM|nr:hypothetical protein [Endozoicomonas gorgoniicola]MCW7552117.1 hypothetical protein [Endozoicomonas gorgoniicola]